MDTPRVDASDGVGEPLRDGEVGFALAHPPYHRGGGDARLSLRAGPLEEEPGPREADRFVVPRGAVDRGGEDFEGATMRVGEGRHGTGDRVRRCFHHSLQRREL